MADIVIINPRFEVSYWGLEHAMPIFGKRANMPVGCLPLLAALTPEPHTVTLIDENVEPIDFERCARADIVGVTGMIVQRARMRAVLEELKRRGAFTVVGGPWVSVSEDYFGDLADVVFVGEAEETWPCFLAAWQQGEHEARYAQAGKTDMSRVPVPRFDLLKMGRYAFGSLQFSRGCPFRCEFCDIIVIYGRRPRIKTTAQIIAELEALLREGVRVAFIVDDNLVGNKKAIKDVLREVIAWQESNGYALTFFTEASLDLAEDEELMRLMVDANILSVFVGIESPNEASLIETKKFQNVRGGATMLDKVHAIQSAGMVVWSGMILGFDNDDHTIFDAQRRFIKEARIVSTMIGMLHAIPKTPLHARLALEGRLDTSDAPAFGTNVLPLRLSREALHDGYVDILRDLHEPEAYFARLDELCLGGGLGEDNGRRRYWRQHPWRRIEANALLLAQSAVLFARLMLKIPEAELRREYRRRVWRYVTRRGSPSVLFLYVLQCAMHFHAHVLAREVARGEAAVTNSF